MMGATDRRHDVQGLGLRHRHGAGVVGRHHADQERLRRPGEVLQHHADRQQRRQPGPDRVLAEPDARRRTPCRRTRRSRRSRTAGRARSASPTSPAPAGRGHGAAPAPRRRATARPSTCRSRSPGGDARGTFNVCISKVEPVVSGSTGTGGSGGGTTSCAHAERLGHDHARSIGDAHVMCPKDYIVQNNAWGSTAGQTITFGPGTKMKVTVQNENRHRQHARPPATRRSSPARTTTAARRGSGLPRAISQIAAGSVQTSWTWADNGATGSYNAAYDVWFSTGSGGDPAAVGAERRLPDGLVLQAVRQPADRQRDHRTARSTIGGKQFSIWYGTNSGKPCRLVRRAAEHQLVDVQPGRLHPGRDRAQLLGHDQVPELRAGT